MGVVNVVHHTDTRFSRSGTLRGDATPECTVMQQGMTLAKVCHAKVSEPFRSITRMYTRVCKVEAVRMYGLPVVEGCILLYVASLLASSYCAAVLCDGHRVVC